MKIHILGVAGTFMSGIAILAKRKGHDVTGSDTSCYDPIKSLLQKEKIDIIKGYKIKDIRGKDLIIVGNVMSRGNNVIEYILKNKINYTSGPAWLYENILKNKKIIAVSGTHGKTTTTAMIVKIPIVTPNNDKKVLMGLAIIELNENIKLSLISLKNNFIN